MTRSNIRIVKLDGSVVESELDVELPIYFYNAESGDPHVYSQDDIAELHVTYERDEQEN